MVKRVTTPPPPDDEPRYLTVTCPYPPYADMEDHDELVAFVRWLACAMGGQYKMLFAVFHKPSAANMIVVEISREFSHFRKLLGAHYWSKFVLHPGQYASQVSRIFFSFYPNGRAVEKAGWKRIFVEDVWFEGWHPHNKIIAHPYPESSYCQVPQEDPISAENCRPLPREMFDISPPPPPPLVPVGSSSWVAHKSDKNVQDQAVKVNTDSCDSKKVHDRSHSSLEPVLSNDLVKGGFNTTPFAASDVELSTSYAGTSVATDISGLAMTINGGTIMIPWDTESNCPNEGIPNSTVLFDANAEEDDNDEYNIGMYNGMETYHYEYPKKAPFSSIHPLLVKKDKPSCPTHGAKCKTKICKDYNSFIRRSDRMLEHEKRRQEMGDQSAKFDRNAWVGGVGKGRGFKGRVGKAGNAIIDSHSRQNDDGHSQPFARIDDEELGGTDEYKAYDTTALSDSLSQGSTRLSSKSVSVASSALSFPELSDTQKSNASVSAWASNTPATQRKPSPEKVGQSGISATSDFHFPALNKDSTGDKLNKVGQSHAGSTPSFAASVKGDIHRSVDGMTSLNGSKPPVKRLAPVLSWSKVVSQASPGRSAGVSPSGTDTKNTPPSIGRVITSSGKPGASSNTDLTVPWEEIMDEHPKEEERW